MNQDEIIYLEPDEEITSVIDKLQNTKTNRLALVVPRDATLLQSVVNLKLLVKEAHSRGKDISLITTDKIGRNLAAQVGLVVYDSIKDRRPVFQPATPELKAEEVIEIDMSNPMVEQTDKRPKGVEVHHFQEERNWQKQSAVNLPKKNFIKKDTPRVKINHDYSKIKKIIWPVLGIIFILIIVAAFLFLPYADVVIKVKAEPFNKNLDIVIDTGSTDVSAVTTSNNFSGTMLESTKEKEEKFSATGKKNLGGKANGTLTLYNYWDSTSQPLTIGTKFSSSSKTFVSLAAVTIPGTAIRGGNIVAGTATVDVEASEAGEEYNVKAGRFSIVGLSSAQQEKIYGQSSKDLTGGFTKEVTVVSQSDYDKAAETLSKGLNEELTKDLESEANQLEILEKAIVFSKPEIISSAKVEAEASDFTMKINQKARALAFDRIKFDQFVIDTLEKEIATDQMISLGPTDSIVPEKVEPLYDQNQLKLNLKVTAKISSKLDTTKIKNELKGKSKATAENYLANLYGTAGADIVFRPSFWLKRISNLDRMVTVSLDYVEPSPTSSPTLSPTPLISPTNTSNIEVTP